MANLNAYKAIGSSRYESTLSRVIKNSINKCECLMRVCISHLRKFVQNIWNENFFFLNLLKIKSRPLQRPDDQIRIKPTDGHVCSSDLKEKNDSNKKNSFNFFSVFLKIYQVQTLIWSNWNTIRAPKIYF